MAGELFTQDLRRNSVTWVLYDLAAFDNPAEPTLAELNTTNPALKLDITCALDEESTTFTVGSSDQDERLSFCDGVGTSRPAGTNPEAALAIYRDKDRDAAGVFNAAFDWLRHEDFPFYLLLRVGPQDSGATGTGIGETSKAFELTDHLRLGRFRTDYPIDTLADADPALLSVNPIPDGFLKWNQPPSA